MQRRVRIAMAVLICLSGSPRLAKACVYHFDPVRVGPSFRVKVTDRGRGVSALALRVHGSGVEQQVVTDRDGFVLLRNLRPGSYNIGPTVAGNFASSVSVEVQSDGAESAVEMKWPGIPVVRASALKGVLNGTDRLPRGKLEPVALEVIDAVRGTTLKSGRAATNGAFDFSEVGPGMYFLRVGGTGVIAVEVAPDGEDGILDLDLAFTSCGLFYSSRRNCRSPELPVRSLTGTVTSSFGSPMRDVEIVLMDSGGALTKKVRSGNDGSFAMPQVAEGSYQLVIRSAGFSSLQAPVRVTRDPAASIGVDARLGVMGACSTASLR